MTTDLAADPIRNVVQLDFTNVDGVLVVTPRDQDRFTIKMRRAVAVLQHSHQIDAFRDQFNVLLRTLAMWLHDRDDVRAAYITLRDGALAFVVVRKESECNEEFEDALSQLDLDVANDSDLSLIDLNAIALPPVSEYAMNAFLDSTFLLSYAHGDGSRPHSAG